MAKYHGHRSWNAWNVSLWIGNDEGLYRIAVRALRSTTNLHDATNAWFSRTGLRGLRTPDGAVYSDLSVSEALKGLEIQ